MRRCVLGGLGRTCSGDEGCARMCAWVCCLGCLGGVGWGPSPELCSNCATTTKKGFMEQIRDNKEEAGGTGGHEAPPYGAVSGGGLSDRRAALARQNPYQGYHRHSGTVA